MGENPSHRMCFTVKFHSLRSSMGTCLLPFLLFAMIPGFTTSHQKPITLTIRASSAEISSRKSIAITCSSNVVLTGCEFRIRRYAERCNQTDSSDEDSELDFLFQEGRLTSPRSVNVFAGGQKLFTADSVGECGIRLTEVVEGTYLVGCRARDVFGRWAERYMELSVTEPKSAILTLNVLLVENANERHSTTEESEYRTANKKLRTLLDYSEDLFYDYDYSGYGTDDTDSTEDDTETYLDSAEEDTKIHVGSTEKGLEISTEISTENTRAAFHLLDSDYTTSDYTTTIEPKTEYPTTEYPTTEYTTTNGTTTIEPTTEYTTSDYTTGIYDERKLETDYREDNTGREPSDMGNIGADLEETNPSRKNDVHFTTKGETRTHTYRDGEIFAATCGALESKLGVHVSWTFGNAPLSEDADGWSVSITDKSVFPGGQKTSEQTVTKRLEEEDDGKTLKCTVRFLDANGNLLESKDSSTKLIRQADTNWTLVVIVVVTSCVVLVAVAVGGLVKARQAKKFCFAAEEPAEEPEHLALQNQYREPRVLHAGMNPRGPEHIYEEIGEPSAKKKKSSTEVNPYSVPYENTLDRLKPGQTGPKNGLTKPVWTSQAIDPVKHALPSAGVPDEIFPVFSVAYDHVQDWSTGSNKIINQNQRETGQDRPKNAKVGTDQAVPGHLGSSPPGPSHVRLVPLRPGQAGTNPASPSHEEGVYINLLPQTREMRS